MTLHGNDQWGDIPRDPMIQCDDCGVIRRSSDSRSAELFGTTAWGDPVYLCGECEAVRDRNARREANNHDLASFGVDP